MANMSTTLRNFLRENFSGLYKSYDSIRKRYRSWLPAPTPEENKRIYDLRAMLSRLPRLHQASPTDSAGVGVLLRNQIHKLFLTRDPRAFLQWDYIRWALYNPGPIPEEVEFLMQTDDWRNRWSLALKESPTGVPDKCPLYPETSWNLAHHAYALSFFERTTGKKVESFNTVLEFGGGYGSMCRLFHQLGFRGHYIIYDFPELSALQRYYLTSIGLKLDGESGLTVHFVNELDDISKVVERKDFDLFVATWSLSETPFDFRQTVLSKCRANHYVIGYQEKYFELDNVSFFSQWIQSRRELNWTDWCVPHGPNTRYLSGTNSFCAARTDQ